MPKRIKLSSKFKPLWESTEWDYCICTGGRGSSKSFSVGLFIENLSFERNHVILFTRYTLTSAHLSVIPEFLEKVEIEGHREYFNITKTDIRNTSSDSLILFRGIKTSSGDQTANLKSIQGLSTLVIDEAEELNDENTFDKIDQSVRSNLVKNRVIMILNPTTKEHFIYKRFFEDAGVQEGYNGIKNRVLYIHTTYEDNRENLSDKFLKQAAKLKEINHAKYNHIMLGGWLDRSEGVILTNWELGEFKMQPLHGVGLDFGVSDPDAMLRVAIDNKAMKIYVKELMYDTDQSTDTLLKQIAKKVNPNELIVADAAEKRLIGDIYRAGYNIKKANKQAGSIIAGIKKLQDYQLIIDPDSVNLVKELNNYSWHDKKAEVPIDAYNHLIDAMRYVVMDLVGWKRKSIKVRKS